MRNLLAWVMLLSGVIACSKPEIPEQPPLNTDKAFTSFSFKSANNSLALLRDLRCSISGDTIFGRVPYLTTLDSMVASFSVNGVLVQVEEKTQLSDVSYINFKSPVTYTVYAEDGTSRNYTVILTQLNGLPIVSIDTKDRNPVNSKEEYREGEMKIIADGRTESDYTGKMQIRGRGNSTWDMPKKPYRIKLNSKASVLGMPADKDWVLLANYADKTLMRNRIAFSVSEIFAPSYTPRGQFVDLFLNGEYMGNYFLTEHMKVADNRIKLSESSDEDTGFLLEVDARLDEDNWFYTPRGIPVCIKSPDADDISNEQLRFITDYVNKTEAAIYSDNFGDPENGFRKYIDEESFIKWYWVNELMKNNDAVFFSSVFMYKDRGGKLSLGPVWDFDISSGNVNYNDNYDPPGWWIRASRWIDRLFEDPEFKKKAKSMWIQAQPQLSNIAAMADKYAQQLKYSQQQNFEKWNILDTGVWPNLVVLGSYENEVQYLKYWLDKRAKWISAEISNDD